MELEDKITFTSISSPQTQVTIIVTGLSRFKSFRNLFVHLNGESMGWEKDDSIDKKVLDIRQYYSEEDEQKYGVLAILMELANF